MSAHYALLENQHSFRFRPLDSFPNMRMQLTPAKVTILWGKSKEVDNKWHIVTLKFPSYLYSQEKASVRADMLYELLEGEIPNFQQENFMLTLEKAIQVWPNADILFEFKVRFLDNKGTEISFAPSDGELISYAADRGVPIKIHKQIATWKISPVNGKWTRQKENNVLDAAIGIVKDFKKEEKPKARVAFKEDGE